MELIKAGGCEHYIDDIESFLASVAEASVNLVTAGSLGASALGVRNCPLLPASEVTINSYL